MISIVMDSNERGTDRADALQAYLMRHPKDFDFAFGDVPVDLVFSLPKPMSPHPDEQWAKMRKFWAVELKMPSDFVQSLQNGHLGQQRRQCPYPLQVAVLGSFGDVLRALPEVTGNGWRNPSERAQADGMIRRGVAALKASGVDVSFGLGPLDLSYSYSPSKTEPQYWNSIAEDCMRENMAQICREASHYLKGDYHLPTAKCETPLEAMLQCIPGIGKEKSKALIDAGLRLRKDPPDFDVTTINGFGKKAAENIDRALM